MSSFSEVSLKKKKKKTWRRVTDLVKSMMSLDKQTLGSRFTCDCHLWLEFADKNRLINNVRVFFFFLNAEFRKWNESSNYTVIQFYSTLSCPPHNFPIIYIFFFKCLVFGLRLTVCNHCLLWPCPHSPSNLINSCLTCQFHRKCHCSDHISFYFSHR